MQLLIISSKQSFTQMTHYYTSIKKITDTYVQVSCRVYRSVCKWSCAKEFNISHNYQFIARDLTTGFLLGLQHILATPLQEACLSIPNYKAVFSLTLPPVSIWELLISLKIFSGLNIQLRLRDALSFFVYFKIVLKLCPYSTWAQCAVQSGKNQFINCCSWQSCLITQRTKCFLKKPKRNEK